MDVKIAVEDNLSSFASYLQNKGFEVNIVDSPNSAPLNDYDAVVVSGHSNNFLNMQNTSTTAPVIDASGLTDEQVYQRIKRVLKS